MRLEDEGHFGDQRDRLQVGERVELHVAEDELVDHQVVGRRHQQGIAVGPSTLTVRVIRNFGRPNQSEELIDLEMDAEGRDQRYIGKITIE